MDDKTPQRDLGLQSEGLFGSRNLIEFLLEVELKVKITQHHPGIS